MNLLKSCLVFICLVSITTLGCAQDREAIPINCDRIVTVLPVQVGTITIPNMLLDTGFSYDGIIIYNPAYRDSLDLSGAISVQIGGAGNGQGQPALMLDSAGFRVGNTSMEKQRIILLQSNLAKEWPTSGVIGYSLLGHYAVEINYDSKVMLLHEFGQIRPDESWRAIPIYFKENQIPWIEAGISTEGEEPVVIQLYIDCAARENIELLEKPMMNIRLPRETTNSYLGTGLSGDIYGKRGRISRFILGPYQIDSLDVSIAQADVRSKQPGADAIVGSGLLSRFNVIFDYQNKKLYLKPNSRYTPPTR